MGSLREEELQVLLINPWAEQYAEVIRSRFPGLNLLVTKTQAEALEQNIADVDVVVSWEGLAEVLPRINNLKWFQVLSAGFEQVLGTGVLPKEAILTNVAGAAAVPVSEFVFTFLLAIVKRVPEMLENQRQHKFELYFPGRELHGRTLAVLGLGHIGKAVVKKAKAFGMTVLGYDKYVTELEGAERIYPLEGLGEVLRAADFVVICLPLNDETRGLIGEKELRLMRESAYLINVARAEIVNREAFIRALQEKWIAGAALDVFWGDAANMGLAPDDELWELPNIILSPHCATVTDMYVPRTGEIVCNNPERFLRGEQLINVIPH